MQSSLPLWPRQNGTHTIPRHAAADPYRWLEDADSAQTEDWLRAEDELYESYVSDLPARDRLTGRLAELLNAGHVPAPAWRGDRQFYTRREPGQEHAVLYTAAPGDSDRAL